MVKKLRKQIGGLIGTGIVLGVGSQVVTGVGGSASALTSVSRFMPTLGVAVGGLAVLRTLKGLNPIKKKRRRR